MNKFLQELPIFGESGLEDGQIDLSRNECRFPAYKIDFSRASLNSYPSSKALTEKLAYKHGVKPRQIILGNGATDLLNVAARASLCVGKVGQVDEVSYKPIETIIKKTGATVSNEFGNVRFIVHPNNPTGEFRRPDTNVSDYDLFVVDEAYQDYYPDGFSFTEMVNHHNNLVVIKTFSKIHALAGLRVGYAIASERICGYLRVIQNQYPLSSLSIHAATKALDHDKWEEYVIHETGIQRRNLTIALRELKIEIMNPCANFIAAKIPFEVDGFKIRDLGGGYSDSEGWKRITVGTKSEMTSFIKNLKEAIKLEK